MNSPTKPGGSPALPIIEQSKVGVFQIGVVAMCLATLILDGLDVQALAFSGPLILKEWQISSAVLAPAVAAAMIGMAVGTPSGGSLGDRFGRRRILIASVALFGLATAAMALSQGPNALAALRFVAGLGFGAAIPNAMALVTEWLPRRAQTQAMGTLALGTVIGGTLGAGLSPLILEDYGWRVTFGLCGGATLLLWLILLAFLPESPSFLLRSGQQSQAAKALARAFPAASIGPEIETAPRALEADTDTAGPGVFSAGSRRVTYGLMAALFGNSYVGYLIMGWLPVLLTSIGLQLNEAIQGSFAFTAAGMVGVLAGTVIVPRVGSKWPSLVSIALGVVALLGLYGALTRYAPSDFGLVIAGLTMLGVATGVAQATLFAMASRSYRSRQRATGIGVTTGAGRIGGIVAMFSGGLLLSVEAHQLLFLFGMMAAALVFAFIGLLIIDRHLEPSNTEAKAC